MVDTTASELAGCDEALPLLGVTEEFDGTVALAGVGFEVGWRAVLH